ncbi:hypothetical protein GDO81_016038 [Engystomops pustulosus]|uniref:Uncharacterized protein n=1 Tax=Engystomops pustulosus TaxID=76066 RepID=A0AAV7AV06_ENGPU|nr:hypothetical protein GDO81_016038 [Engystomops pustulosus]
MYVILDTLVYCKNGNVPFDILQVLQMGTVSILLVARSVTTHTKDVSLCPPDSIENITANARELSHTTCVYHSGLSSVGQFIQ